MERHDVALAGLAGRQHGLVTAAQAGAAGPSRTAATLAAALREAGAA